MGSLKRFFISGIIEPAFKKEPELQRREFVKEAISRLKASVTKATEKLIALLDEKNKPNIQLRIAIRKTLLII